LEVNGRCGSTTENTEYLPNPHRIKTKSAVYKNESLLDLLSKDKTKNMGIMYPIKA
jgi:hypothetical protein